MNWGRAKTLLIVLFLVLDIFLLVILIHTKLRSVYIADDTVQKTAQILNEHQIHVQADSIPEKRAENQNLVMNNYFATPEQAAENILGRQFETKLSDSAQHMYIFENRTAVLHVKDSDFTYVVKDKQKNSETDSDAKREEIERIISKELDAMGFHRDTLTLSFCRQEGSLFTYKAIPLYKDFEIHGICMHIMADSPGILTISGNWFETVDTENHEESLLDVTTVLTDLMYQPAFQGIQLTEIKNGFLAFDEYVKSRRIAVVPVYILVTETEEYYFDARTGEQIQ